MTAGFTAKDDSFAAGNPRMWTETRLRYSVDVPSFDLTPDGERLAAIVAAEASGDELPTRLTFLLSFIDEPPALHRPLGVLPALRPPSNSK